MSTNPLRVLIIGQSKTDASNLTHALERGNYTLDIVHVESEAQYHQLIHSPSKPDIILSDYDTVLSFSGREALAALKKSRLDIPFVVVSDILSEQTMSDIFHAGANDYLLKGSYIRLLPLIERDQREKAERNKQLEVETQLRLYNQRLITLHAIDQAILNDVAPQTVCNYALRFIATQMGVTSGEIIMFNTALHEASVLASYHHLPGAPKTPVGENFSIDTIDKADFAALNSGIVRHIASISDETQLVYRQNISTENIKSYLMVPITSLEGLIGAIVLFSDQPYIFSPANIEAATEVSLQLAIAIRQGRFVDQIQRSSAELEQRVSERTKALQSATHRMAAILNNTTDAIIVTDSHGRIQETNPAFRELFGYFGETMIGFDISQMFDPEEEMLLEEALKAAVTFGKADNIEATGIRADGTDFEADIAVVSILENGTLENIVYSVRDVTRRKLVERELRVMLDQQRELNDLKSRFVSMASHEFRTPLAIIRTTTDMLGAYRNRMDEATIDMRLDKIRAQITHMANLMDDVLTLARDQAGKSTFDAEIADLDEFCRDIIEQFRAEPETTHIIDYSCTPQPLILPFDKTLMRKVVNNLLSNAIKYSPKGSHVGFELSLQENLVKLRISDTGVGIPEADQKRLFEAFHRGSNVGTVSGTGLGLTITKQSIEAHGGTLHFESRIDEGTTFIATFPIQGNTEGMS